MGKLIYFFQEGQAEGNREMREQLGVKGSNLAEMANIPLPVPPGFTLTTECCRQFHERGGKWSEELQGELKTSIDRLETLLGRKLGHNQNPLLLSVRGGAAVPMPGTIDTVLNLGLNPDSVHGLIVRTGNARFGWDCYRRFITMFGTVVMGLDPSLFDDILTRERRKAKVRFDSQLKADRLREVAEACLKLCESETPAPFPMDPLEQLRLAIGAVLRSWNNPRAVRYRENQDLTALPGTAVNVQAMVFGNMGHTSFAGVAFTRSPSDGTNELYGEYLVNAQGEDLVSGPRTPKSVWRMADEALEEFRDDELEVDRASASPIYKRTFAQLQDLRTKLEAHYRDMEDFEFTAQEGTLYVLQARTGNRTAEAAVRIAVDMVAEGLIDVKTAVMRVEAKQLEQLLHKQFDREDRQRAEEDGRLLAKGISASPGACVGRIALTTGRAEAMAGDRSKEPVVLVREETTPEDIGGMGAAAGILTGRGGMTSHAAVVARGMGKCCVVGCGTVMPHPEEGHVKIAGHRFREGDYISLDGGTGELFRGRIRLVDPEISGAFAKLLEWADSFRKIGDKVFGVRTNADTPELARIARKFGAEGIGLCRTEQMFFDDEKRRSAFRRLILSAPERKRLLDLLRQAETAAEAAETRHEKKEAREQVREARTALKVTDGAYRAALRKLLPMQRRDLVELFEAMDGLPVTIRLLDPPLHEFLPRDALAQERLAAQMGLDPAVVRERVEKLSEANPMLGHRGCRLGITYPELYEMQVQAIMEAACQCKSRGVKVLPEIMIPLVGIREELAYCDRYVRRVCEEVIAASGVDVDYAVGTMIEVPRAALTADEIAEVAEFFSFGTNDLTQMTYGFSRDDSGVFLQDYLDLDILARDPFQSLDRSGVGQLVQIGAEQGRKTRPDLEIGICGEHGGEPASVEFCYRIGMNYVSCSPYRVPVARLAAAQAALKQQQRRRP